MQGTNILTIICVTNTNNQIQTTLRATSLAIGCTYAVHAMWPK